jgi:hypothetical protein
MTLHLSGVWRVRPLKVKPTDTVGNIQRTLKVKHGIPVVDQNLQLKNGDPLVDPTRTLHDLGVQDGDAILSKRSMIKPLEFWANEKIEYVEFWANEKIEYGPADEGTFFFEIDMPVPKVVLRKNVLEIL